MTAIKTESGAWDGARSYGAAKRVGGVRKTSGRRPWVPYKEYVASKRGVGSPGGGTLMSRVTSEVARRLKNGGGLSSPAMGKPRHNTVYASTNRLNLQQGHADDTVTFLPVTWGIPTERRATDAPDDRYRVSNDTFLTGARVRFSVLYKEAFRIRMALYRVSNSQNAHVFRQAPLGGAMSVHPQQAFDLDWVPISHQNILSVGPYEYVNVNRVDGGTAPAPAPVWMISSSDGTPFCADLASGERKPLATFQMQRNGNGTNASVEVNWYVPIKKVVKFIRELETSTWSSGYQIMFYYDCPSVDRPTQPHTVAVIPRMSVKVYYR